MDKIKQGYKQTEIGIIPEDWDVLSFLTSTILKARIGWQGLTTAEYLKSGDYGLVTGTDFKNGYVDWHNCHFVEAERYKQDRNIQLKNNDVLITKDGTIGKVAYVNDMLVPSTLNSGVFVARSINNLYIHKYLFYILTSSIFKDFLSRLQAGSTINHLYQKDFINFEFPAPKDKKEQEAIAGVLSDVDELILSLEKLISKKQDIKQATMKKLLTPKDGWILKTLGSICDIYQPETISSSVLTDYGYPVWGANGIIGFYNSYNHEKSQVLVTCRGSTCGIINYSNPKSWITGNAMVLNVDFKKVINKLFLYYLMTNHNLNHCITGSGQPQIVREPLLVEQMCYPNDIKEQERIASILSDMDYEINGLKARLEKTKMLKQGMMEELLTGKTRLI